MAPVQVTRATATLRLPDRVAGSVITVPERCTADGAESVASFAQRSGLELLRFAYLLCGDRQRAEDLLQDVFLNLYRRAATRSPSPVRSCGRATGRYSTPEPARVCALPRPLTRQLSPAGRRRYPSGRERSPSSMYRLCPASAASPVASSAHASGSLGLC